MQVCNIAGYYSSSVKNAYLPLDSPACVGAKVNEYTSLTPGASVIESGPVRSEPLIEAFRVISFGVGLRTIKSTTVLF